MIRKAIYTLLDTLSVLAIVAALVALLTVVLTPAGGTPSLMGYSVLRVLTGSMEPTLSTNSLVVVHKTEPADIQPGDIISFYSADPSLDGALNTHRVVSVEERDGAWQFTTQGDANALADQYPVADKYVLGKVVFTSIKLGILVSLLTNPLLFVFCIAIPLILMVVYNLYRTVRSTLDIMHAEEQEAVRLAVENLRRQSEAAHARKSGENETSDGADNTTH